MIKKKERERKYALCSISFLFGATTFRGNRVKLIRNLFVSRIYIYINWLRLILKCVSRGITSCNRDVEKLNRQYAMMDIAIILLNCVDIHDFKIDSIISYACYLPWKKMMKSMKSRYITMSLSKSNAFLSLSLYIYYSQAVFIRKLSSCFSSIYNAFLVQGLE